METDVLDKIYGKRVVLYGCGRAGENFYLQNTVYPVCDIVLLIDQSVKELHGRKVYKNSCINKFEYDYVVVAYMDLNIRKSIEKSLTDLGIIDKALFIQFGQINFLSYMIKRKKVDTSKIKDFCKFNKWFVDCLHNNKKRYIFVNSKKKIAYLQMTKCGSSSFEYCIKNSDSENVYKTTDIPNDKQIFLFTYVRNPFVRIVSCYVNRIVSYAEKRGGYSYFESISYYGGYLDEDEGFEVFAKKIAEIPDALAEDHFRSMYLNVYENGEKIVDFVGKLEEANETFEDIRKNFDLPQLQIRNVSPGYRWQDYYTLELAEIVYKRYKEDFEYFGYEEEYAKLVEEIKNRDKEIMI